MADFNENSTQTRSRLRIPPSLRPALFAVLGVAVLLLIVAGTARRGKITDAGTVSSPAPAAVLPAREEEPEPDWSAAAAPADTSAELSVRTALKRDGFPMLRWDPDLFVKGDDGRMRYAGPDRTLTGIDVSEHQYDVDWNKVAADGIDFAMVRLGYRGSTSGGLYLDEYFDRNMAGANAAGLPVGVYFYSQAVSVEEAKEEAAFVLESLRPYRVSFPVVFDWEIVGGDSARTYSVSRQTLVECTRAFCEQIREAGYDPMIYFTRYLGYRKYILRNLTDYGFWYAEYEDRPRFAIDFDMWQYSDTGRVDGIDGDVDLNILFLR